MTIQEQMTLTLFNKDVKDQAREMFKTDFEFNGFKDRYPVELFDMSFRLFKPTNAYVNLELMISSPFGTFFQVIGMFDENRKLYILNEYIDSYNNLKKSKAIDEEVLKLNLKSNAVIAAYSTLTIELVAQIFQDFQEHGWTSEVKFGHVMPPGQRYDRKYICNGLKCELIFTNNGFPQFFLDDEHGLEGSITQYTLKSDGTLNFHPDSNYSALLQNLKNLHLLSAFNGSDEW